ncbi:MAG: efflux RND transporter periplasmic adaptor subunit, partial [Acetobacteraceae bacterium]|nr:efflux RND transporter periplasmic adaptor subunit [Acetobacteraceae bacterium]
MQHRATLRLVLSACLLAAPAPLVAQQSGPTPPPPAVIVAPVQVEDVAPVYTYIGHMQAIQTVDLMARVTAFIDSVAFQQGADVKKGEVLFQLEKAPFEAAVQAAQAQLQKAQANYAQAQVALERSQRLNQQGFEAQANLDQATATRDSDAADVLAAQANLKTAGINLSYCTITSPIDGRIGAETYTQGNLVTPSSKPLATVNQLDPIRVVFSVTDRDFVTVQQRTNQPAHEIAETLTVSLRLPNGASYSQEGKISFIDNQVDPTTGTITVWANFA